MSQLNLGPYPGNDNQVFDRTEVVSYYNKIADNKFATPYSIATVLRRAQRRTIQMGDNRIETVDLTFHIGANNIPSGQLPPKYGDNILDKNGVKWTVLDVEYDTWITRYRVGCKRLNTTTAMAN